MSGSIMTDAKFQDTEFASSGFEHESKRHISFRLANALAASLAVMSLSLCLVIALTALSIKVMAATAISG